MFVFLSLLVLVTANLSPCSWCDKTAEGTQEAESRKFNIKVLAAANEIDALSTPAGKTYVIWDFEYEAVGGTTPSVLQQVMVERSRSSHPTVFCDRNFEVGKIYQFYGKVEGQRLYVAPCGRILEQASFVGTVKKSGLYGPIVEARRALVLAVRDASLLRGGDEITAAQRTFGAAVESIVVDYWTKFAGDFKLKLDELGFKFAWLAAGSMVRDEMCPFSDIEFMMAVDKKDKAVAAWRSEDKKIKIFRQRLTTAEKSILQGFLGVSGEAHGSRYGLTKRWVMIDAAINPGYTPQGPERDNMNTPTELANNAKASEPMQVRTTVGSLRSLDRMQGQDSALGAQALSAIQTAVLADKHQFAKAYMNLAFTEFFKYLNDNTFDLSPPVDANRPTSAFSKDNRLIQMVNVKKALIRPFHFAVEGLVIHYGLFTSTRTTFAGRVDALVAASKLSSTLGARLKRAVQAAFRLRILVHDHFGKESDKLYLEGAPQGQYGASANEKAVVLEILSLRDAMYTRLNTWKTAKDNKLFGRNVRALKDDIAECKGTICASA